MLCDDTWRMRWRRKNTILKDCKIKHFYKNGEFALYEILIIDKLVEKEIL